ncbi:phage terminase large subunit [Enterobacter ludwigii]|uniref:phage terminase large subunit n=1 Tax=Enterobacter ludwigii TaxID=299767 RepID=UPI003BEF16DD
MSRLANDGFINDKDGKIIKCPRTPIVIIMQRVHDEDLVGFLLRGGSADTYQYLNIPAIVDKECGSQEWYDKLIARQAYTNAIPYLYDLKRTEESALWPARKSYETLKEMKAKTPYTFNSQYMGDPTAQGNGLISEEWWFEYDKETFDYSTIVRTFLTADTASTIKTYSDYSVVCYWGVTRNRDLVLLDVIIGKYETPELKKAILKFWAKCNKLNVRYPLLMPRALYMEDKSSGQFLNQQFVREGNIRCLPVPRDKSGGDKVARFLNTIPYFAQSRIWFPAGHEHLGHIKREVLGMTSQGSGTGHDDVCDNISDAVAVEFSGKSANYLSWV